MKSSHAIAGRSISVAAGLHNGNDGIVAAARSQLHLLPLRALMSTVPTNRSLQLCHRRTRVDYVTRSNCPCQSNGLKSVLMTPFFTWMNSHLVRMAVTMTPGRRSCLMNPYDVLSTECMPNARTTGGASLLLALNPAVRHHAVASPGLAILETFTSTEILTRRLHKP